MPQSHVTDPAELCSSLTDPAIRDLFTEKFVRSMEHYDRLVDAAAWRILAGLGALPDTEGLDLAEAVARAGAAGRAVPVIDFLLRKLADTGWLEKREGRFYSSPEAPGSPEEIGAILVEYEPGAAVGVELVNILVEEAPAFFSGEKTGEDILFAVNRLPLWFRYFANSNPLYSINNRLGAVVLGTHMPSAGAAVLEIGGGAGSAAEKALERLSHRIERYHFTELVPTFLRRGERAARAAAAGSATRVETGKLDMTKPWAEQGIPPATYDAVYSVNCFHVAPDLDEVLRQALAALRPGGWLVLSECVKPRDPFRAIYVDFIFEFLASFTKVSTHPERRPVHGFLSPAAWRASLGAAGFETVEVIPDVEELAERFPNFFVAAVAAQKPLG